ncbi:MAG TPA: pyridoxal-phosphate dependent enzyme, partial [Chthoniobacterales bacterium]
ATDAIRDSRGAIDIVTDEEILDAQQWLASNEGIFVEPASAASIAGLFKCCDRAHQPRFAFAGIEEGSQIVCTVTGHGLKDPDAVRFTTAAAVAAGQSDVLSAIGF